MKYIKLFESISDKKETDLVLYHGSSSEEIIDKFNSNTFFTVNDYIATNYAFNNAGYLYKVKVNNLNPLEITEDVNRLKRSSGGLLTSGTDHFLIDLFKKVYGEDSDIIKKYKKHGYGNSLTTLLHTDFYESDIYVNYKPLIEYAKSNGYDSLKFLDESFDTYVRDVSYIIFDSNKIDVMAVYDVEEFGLKGFQDSDLIKRIK